MFCSINANCDNNIVFAVIGNRMFKKQVVWEFRKINIHNIEIFLSISLKKFRVQRFMKLSATRVSVSHDIRLLYNQVETIWDVGAHGESALEFAREFPNALIKALSQSPLNYLCLVENCRHLKNHSVIN